MSQLISGSSAAAGATNAALCRHASADHSPGEIVGPVGRDGGDGHDRRGSGREDWLAADQA